MSVRARKVGRADGGGGQRAGAHGLVKFVVHFVVKSVVEFWCRMGSNGVEFERGGAEGEQFAREHGLVFLETSAKTVGGRERGC